MMKLLPLRVMLGLFVAVVYGLAIYMLVWLPPDGAIKLISGVLLLAMGIGSITGVVADPLGQRDLGQYINMGLAALAVTSLLTVVLFAEGVICLIMAAPIMVPGAIFGAWIARATIRWWRSRRGAMMVIALPLLVLPIETRMDWPEYQGQVTTAIIINAPPETVWAETVEIRDIDPDRLRFTPSHNLMFFPRPLDARLDRQGVGATRYLTWTSGVSFREYITEWDQPRRLGWTFGFDPDSIPPELDAHLRPDGEASKLLRGEYVLEDLGDGRTRLILTTHYGIALPVNAYGRWWADRLLGDFHTVVLDVVKARAEQHG
ncbi:MAG: hypothetical protein Q4G25_11915 [Paracoccus sp. (in: a-proteobacteria)]|nr:hypothetical protein [Paracoccus sp. (in: a-proteobacteria)]